MAKEKVARSPKKPNPIEFVKALLEKDPKIEYAKVKARADKAKVTIYPVIFGRAKALLGLVKISPYGTGKTAQKNAERKSRAMEVEPGKNLTVTSIRPPAKPKGGRRKYTDEYKAKVVLYIQQTGEGIVSVSRKIDVNKSLVQKWVTKHGGLKGDGTARCGPNRPVGRPRGSKNKNRSAFGNAVSSFTEALRELQKERDAALKLVAKMRRVVLKGLDEKEIAQLEAEYAADN
jgi:transposase-like protein